VTVAAKCAVFYEPAENVAEKAPLHFAAHREQIDRFHERGDLLMVGPFADAQADGSLAVFRSRAAAEEFVAEDPFVLNGVVARYRLLDWDEVLVAD
jgi:uncharacterized protein YciI